MQTKDARDGMAGDNFLGSNDLTWNPGTRIFSCIIAIKFFHNSEIFNPPELIIIEIITVL